jgi:hypothetical protein
LYLLESNLQKEDQLHLEKKIRQFQQLSQQLNLQALQFPQDSPASQDTLEDLLRKCNEKTQNSHSEIEKYKKNVGLIASRLQEGETKY